MKYIRTSEKIFEIVNETKIVNKKGTKFYYLVSIKGFDNIGQFPAKEWENTPRADTIEELCDFKKVEIISDEESIAIRILGMYKELPPNKNIKSGTYGAILTDKGLIYVAKMNEEGELELL